jgi:tetratricopeptide (TPR) repeat protein
MLGELGYDAGPADGILGPVLKDAIRAYLRRAGHSLDGKLGKEYLQRLESLLERDLLDHRLDLEARRRKELTRAALLSRPETRDLVARDNVRPSDRIADPTRDPAPCFRSPTAKCLLDEATESAKAENRTELRDWAYGDVVAVQAQAGLLTQAFDTARLIDDPRKIVIALRHIAEAHAAQGDTPAALSTVRLVPNPFQQAEALKAILREPTFAGGDQALRRVLDGLETAAAGLGEPSQRVFVLAALATAYWRHGGQASADATLAEARRVSRETVRDPTARAFTLSAIAEALSDMGRPAEALALLDDVQDERDRDSALIKVAEALALAGQSPLALRASRAIKAPRFRAVALAEVANIEASQGDAALARKVFEEAREALGRINDDFSRAFATSRVGFAAAAVVGIDDAVDIARTIGQEQLRAQTLWRIAVAERPPGDPPAGRETERQTAVAATEEIASTVERAMVYAEAATALGRAGRRDDAQVNFERALDLASSVTNPWNRARALTKVASALVALAAQ